MASLFTQKLARWDLFSSIFQNSLQNRLQKMYQLAAIFWRWQPGLCWCDISHEKSSVEDYINRMMDSTQPRSLNSDVSGAKTLVGSWKIQGTMMIQQTLNWLKHYYQGLAYFFLLHCTKVIRQATCLFHSCIRFKSSQLTVCKAHPVRSESCGFHMPPKVLLCTRLALVSTKFVFKSASAALCV